MTCNIEAQHPCAPRSRQKEKCSQHYAKPYFIVAEQKALLCSKLAIYLYGMRIRQTHSARIHGACVGARRVCEGQARV